MDPELLPETVSMKICVDDDDDDDDDDDVEPLSGKPFFHMTMGRSHVSIGYLPIPRKFFRVLPRSTSASVILSRGSRSWEMKYQGYPSSLRKLGHGWKTFVEDNTLNVGDVCIFELMSCEAALIKFKVQVLGGDLPSEFTRQ